jgi:hypothetical protein
LKDAGRWGFAVTLLPLFVASNSFADQAMKSDTITATRALDLHASDSEPIFRLSLPTEEDHEAWRSPGFRVSLGYGRGSVFSSNDVPAGDSYTFTLRTGARLDEDWLLMGSVHYTVVAGGLRYFGFIEPSYELFPGLVLSLGLGVGGLVLPNTDFPMPPEGGIVATYTYANDDPPLTGCSGSGVAGTARVAYNFVVGPLFSTGPALSFDTQVSRCAQTIENADPDTGRAIEIEQYWYHRGVSLAWMLQWR